MAAPPNYRRLDDQYRRGDKRIGLNDKGCSPSCLYDPLFNNQYLNLGSITFLNYM